MGMWKGVRNPMQLMLSEDISSCSNFLNIERYKQERYQSNITLKTVYFSRRKATKCERGHFNLEHRHETIFCKSHNSHLAYGQSSELYHPALACADRWSLLSLLPVIAHVARKS